MVQVQPEPATAQTAAEPQQYIRLADGTFQAVTRQQIVSAGAIPGSAQSGVMQQPAAVQARPQAQGMSVQPGATIVGPSPISVQQAPSGNDGYDAMHQQGQPMMQPQGRPVQSSAGSLAQPPMQVTQPAPPPAQQQGGPMSRSSGPVPPQMQPPRGEAAPGSMGPPQSAQETLYVDDIPLDMSKRELSHIFRPFGGYKVRRTTGPRAACLDGNARLDGLTRALCIIDLSAHRSS